MRTGVALAFFSLLTLMACGSEREQGVTTKVVEVTPPHDAPVKDHTSLFPDAGKVSTSVVPDHLLDMKALPGGSLAEYDVKGTRYREFIIDADSTQAAAFMMLDVKAQLKNPEYISWMGGYSGLYGDKPLYCFAKLHYLAGIVGLRQDKADPLGRTLAAQLH